MSSIRLSAVVATDTYATIEPFVRSLAEQRSPERIELIAVTPRGSVVEPGPEIGRLGGYRVVEVESLDDLRLARIAGFRAATGDVGEVQIRTAIDQGRKEPAEVAALAARVPPGGGIDECSPGPPQPPAPGAASRSAHPAAWTRPSSAAS